MANTTKADVLLIAPELSTASNDLFTLMLADAALVIDENYCASAYQEILQRYYVAHFVTMLDESTSSGSTGGAVERERVGDVEREYANKTNPDSSDMALGSTKYGLEFIRLNRRYRYVRFN